MTLSTNIFSKRGKDTNIKSNMKKTHKIKIKLEISV